MVLHQCSGAPSYRPRIAQKLGSQWDQVSDTLAKGLPICELNYIAHVIAPRLCSKRFQVFDTASLIGSRQCHHTDNFRTRVIDACILITDLEDSRLVSTLACTSICELSRGYQRSFVRACLDNLRPWRDQDGA